MKYVALISYDGSSFCGWQVQKTALQKKSSIQAEIQNALQTLTQESVSVVGSGRTDSGVHALGQVAHFSLNQKQWECYQLRKGLNAHLPPKIRILDVREAPPAFHAQRSAIKKQYSYYFSFGPESLPALNRMSWWVPWPLDLEAMQAGIKFLQGQHDFKAFQASGSKITTPTVKNIFEVNIEKIDHLFLIPEGLSKTFFMYRVRIVGSGFLKQMVRGIVGTLRQMGEKRRPPQDMSLIIDKKDRSLVGPTAPARGLFLDRVWYEELDGFCLND